MHSTSNLEDGYIGSGKRLWNSIRKHGRENHSIEILEWFPDRSSLKDREKQLVNESLLQDPMCMNLQLGGGGGISGKDHAKAFSIGGNRSYINHLKSDIEFRTRLSKMHSEQAKQWYLEGRIVPPDWFGKKHKEETKQKIGAKNSISQRGEKNSQFGKMWITNGIENMKIKKTDSIPDGWRRGRKIVP
jgi:hypothetical protein